LAPDGAALEDAVLQLFEDFEQLLPPPDPGPRRLPSDDVRGYGLRFCRCFTTSRSRSR